MNKPKMPFFYNCLQQLPSCLSIGTHAMSSSDAAVKAVSSPRYKAVSSPRYEILVADVSLRRDPGRGNFYVQPHPDELVAKVNAALTAGATPLGGVSAVILSKGDLVVANIIRYTQAVMYPAGM
jgi:hypothetical protein